jgi:bifunctional DNA-binding transcriptional regulator/antitoxin component of YhaV-PrlF toxin-antitoxin module
MVITTMTGKNQTTLGMEFVKFLGLKPGAKLRQSREGHRIIIEPIGDVMTAFGVFKPPAGMALPSIREEKEAAARSIAEEAMKGLREE